MVNLAELEARLIRLAVTLRSHHDRDVILDALYALRRSVWTAVLKPPAHASLGLNDDAFHRNHDIAASANGADRMNKSDIEADA